jgi:2-C-methyl-D-erythritol 2,4-cyclodiphosphate synthase
LIGHSDADVLLHAITDALLGAANMGDIGEWFPDTDPDNGRRDSQSMLGLVVDRLAAAGYRIVNLDCIVFAEAPKLAPHKSPIRQSIARILGVPAEAVSVKAKTGEGVDAVGQRVAISAQAVVLLTRPEH